MTIRGRALGEGEAEQLAQMTRSRTLGVGLVRRAQIVQHAIDGLGAPEIAARMDLCGATVRFWLKRFNAGGVSGLEEDMRSGRPATYSPEERSAVITAALSRPEVTKWSAGTHKRTKLERLWRVSEAYQAVAARRLSLSLVRLVTLNR